MQQSFSSKSACIAKLNKRSDFRKDVIMPTVYSLENYQYIKSGNYTPHQERKVLTVKKNKVQSVVETIVAKKHVQYTKKIPYYPHTLSRPVSEHKMRPTTAYAPSKPDTMTMDVDEKLNEKILYQEEQSASKKERIKQLMEKVKQIGYFPSLEEHSQLNFYLTSISPAKNRKPKLPKNIYFTTSQIKSKQYKGYVEQQQEKQRQRVLKNKKQINMVKLMIAKDRPKTAGASSYTSSTNSLETCRKSASSKSLLFRGDSLMNTKLSRFQDGNSTFRNLKQTNKNELSKQKCRNLIETIESSCLQSSLSKNSIMVTLNKMGAIWKSEQEFLEAQPSRAILELSDEALGVLVARRKKQEALQQIDKQVIDNQKNAKQQKI